MRKVPAEIIDVLNSYDKILVAAHAQPDGDAVGASAAMGWLLKFLGKNVLLYNASGFPNYLHWLRSPCPVLTKTADLPGKPGLIVALDCGDAARLGDDIQPLLASVPSINIDHHFGNPGFGSLCNWIDPGMAATGEMVGLLAEAMGVPLRDALAECVYVSIMADTGSLSFGNTTPDVLHMTARLLENGLNVPSVRSSLDNNWTESKMRLWGRVLAEARILEGGKLAVGMASLALFEECEASREDIEGLVEQLRRLKGVRVAFLAREARNEDGKIITKVSLRSSGPDDVRLVSVQFGGGGHKNAAGATVPLGMEKALRVMLPYIRRAWDHVAAS